MMMRTTWPIREAASLAGCGGLGRLRPVTRAAGYDLPTRRGRLIGDATLFLLRLRSRAEDNARPEKTYDPRPSAGNRVASPIISGSISGTWLGHA